MPSNAPQPTILIIDDDAEVRYSLERVLGTRGYTVETEGSGENGIKRARTLRPSVILSDIRMEGMSGLETLQHLKSEVPGSMIVLMTAFGTTQTAIEAMKYGAFDYVLKPFDIQKIIEIIEAATAAATSQATAQAEENALPQLNVDDYKEGIVGSSAAMQEVFKMIGQVAGSDVTVMITGESGTGKELVARCVHQHSSRGGSQPFMAVNCAAIPENLIESELFGHERGAFTGATDRRAGVFELCDGGTLFLDEIGDMAPPTQTKILRAIQEGEVQRVGGSGTVKVDVRLICATHRNLEDMVEKGSFREDLYYRLNVVRINLPPLRERKEDIPELVDFQLKRLITSGKTNAKRMSAEALDALLVHSWAGNVRELENVVHRSAVVATGDTILAKDLPGKIRPITRPPLPLKKGKHAASNNTQNAEQTDASASAGAANNEAQLLGHTPTTLLGTPPEAASLMGLKLPAAFDKFYERLRKNEDAQLIAAVETQLIRCVLEECSGNQVRSAEKLGITRATLKKRMEQYDLA